MAKSAEATVSTHDWTVGALLNFAKQDFAEKGFPDSRLAAEVLLAHALGKDRLQLYLAWEAEVSVEVRERFRELILARRRGVPVAYLTGIKEFYSLSFEVNGEVLIPRPETELLVDEILDWIKRSGRSDARICDVGTGSGAIAVAVKKNSPLAQVTALDLLPAALEVAKRNADRNGVTIDFHQSDLLQNLTGPFDVVVANCPYVPTGEWKTLMPGVRDHEPRLALDGGRDGLDLIRRFVGEAGDRLAPNGILLLEIGVDQFLPVEEILGKAGFVVERVRNDLAGIPRVVRARWGEPCR